MMSLRLILRDMIYGFECEAKKKIILRKICFRKIWDFSEAQSEKFDVKHRSKY